MQAGTAELIAPGRYRLTWLLRGQRGTEGAMGIPTPAGARVVVLDDSLAALPIAEAELGIPWTWRIGPASKPVSDETYVAQSFTPEGVRLRPFSVGHVEQPWRRPRSLGDLTIRWTRRSRPLAADGWTGREVPLAEESEAYEVEILYASTVKRVLETSTTSAVYSAAQQTSDRGERVCGPGHAVQMIIEDGSARRLARPRDWQIDRCRLKPLRPQDRLEPSPEPGTSPPAVNEQDPRTTHKSSPTICA